MKARHCSQYEGFLKFLARFSYGTLGINNPEMNLVEVKFSSINEYWIMGRLEFGLFVVVRNNNLLHVMEVYRYSFATAFFLRQIEHQVSMFANIVNTQIPNSYWENTLNLIIQESELGN